MTLANQSLSWLAESVFDLERRAWRGFNTSSIWEQTPPTRNQAPSDGTPHRTRAASLVFRLQPVSGGLEITTGICILHDRNDLVRRKEVVDILADGIEICGRAVPQESVLPTPGHLESFRQREIAVVRDYREDLGKGRVEMVSP